ncbi:hypothetical protein GCM10007049_15350 [Echinicola pacifica]|uniref:Uncharacterized protein n=2 Tax=Echinicola pacifica TaxID=346377 RepID=A0A918PUI1_9BACT|nr:hypothetical protein GCM10007049_15350 [Echinicola pacifica]
MAHWAEAQIVKEFAVKERSGFDQVQLNFSSYKGVSSIDRLYSNKPLMIHAHLSKVNILPEFQYSIDDNTLKATLNHSDVDRESFGKSLSSKLFASAEGDFDHTWEVGLSEDFNYDLNLQFGIGRANVDLSHIKVKKCKINTATADVYLTFQDEAINSVAMDTLLVKVNMGTVDGINVAHANARNLIFDVNYGKVNLNFRKMPHDIGPCLVTTTVGAGAVYIALPSPQYPYIIRINSTAMCRTKLPSYLSELEEKVYVSKGYKKNAANLMEFEIDVSVGSLVLQ